MKFLKFLNKIFHFFVNLRLMLYQSGIFKIKKIDCNIISIGNISFGGTGKTPVTIKIANNLIKKGFKVAVVSRGYKRKNEDNIVIVSDGKNIFTSPEKSGDEPFLIAQKVKCPVIVGKDRFETCKITIENFSPDFIILDDGFQHLKLYRNKDIVLINQNTLILHDTFLREPLKNLNRADVIILTKIIEPLKLKKSFFKIKRYSSAPVFIAEFVIKYFKNLSTRKNVTINDIKDKEVGVFCGIGNPDFFEISLKKAGIKISNFLKFKDHVVYNENFYRKINSLTNTIILTTEKDAVKLDLTKIYKKDILAAILDIEIYKYNPFICKQNKNFID